MQLDLKEEDIINIARIEYGWYAENSGVFFKVLGSKEIESHLGQYKDILNKKQSMTFVINLNMYHWVVLVITQQNQHFSAYYVDSLGEKLPYNIKNLLKNLALNIKDFNIKQHDDLNNCGVFALENAKVINEVLQKSGDPKTAVSDLQLTADSIKTIREEFTKALRRRNRIESKFKVLLKFLKELNKQQSKMEKFNFENANILLFFVEAVAMQDPLLQDSSCQDPVSKLWNYEQKLVDQGIIDCDDLRCVQYIRSNVIFHRDACSIINPADFKDIVNLRQDSEIKQLFKDLEEYVQHTCTKFQGKMSNQNNIKSLRQLFKSHNEIKHFGKTITCNKMKEKIKFFFKNATAKECYDDNRLNLEKANQILFNFVVNIIPFLGKAYKKPAEPLGEIKWFRGDLLHKFYEYGDNYKLVGLALKDFVRSYGPKIFKYYYSQEVHSAFSKIGHREVGYICDYLKDSLKTFQNKFGKEYLASKEEIDKENSFEFVSLELVHSEISDKSGLEVFVHEYFKLMSIIDNEEAIEKRDKKHKESGVPARYKELNANDRREIYEDFKLLKDLYRMTKEEASDFKNIYDKEKKLLQKKFKGPYGILKDDFNAMIKSFVEKEDCVSIDGESNVIYVLNVFKKIKEHHSKLSNKDFIEMFEKRNGKKGNKGSPEVKINTIPEGKTIKILIPSGKADKTETVSINTDRFTKNIFEMLNNTYIKYHLVFNNIEEAFNDEVFLDYLENENVDENLVKKILKIDYMTPYIARLVTKEELINKKIITDKEFLITLEKLFSKEMYIKHLNKLLKDQAASQQTNKPPKLLKKRISDITLKNILKPDDRGYSKRNIRPEFYKQICIIIMNNDVNIENMHLIFEDSVFTSVVLGTLCKEIDLCTVTDPESNAARLIQRILKLLNSIANELYNKNTKEDLDLALKLLEGAKKAQNMLINKNLATKNDIVIIQAKRNTARIRNRQGGLKKCADAKALYKKAKGIFICIKNDLQESLPDTTLFPHFLVTLSDLAYTHHLLQECSQAYDIYDFLYKEMIKSILNLSDDDLFQYKLSMEDYNRIVQSETYQGILKVSPKYLDILKIKSDIAYELKCLADAKQRTLPKKWSLDYKTKSIEVFHNFQSALKTYEEVYEIKEANEKFAQDIVRTIRTIAYLHNKLGSLKLFIENEEKLDCALIHYEKALQKYYKNEEIMTHEKWETHPAVFVIRQDIINVLRNIAFTYNKFGCLKQSSNPEVQKEKVQYHTIALTIYKELFYIQEKTLGEDHEYTLNNMSDIAYTNNNLAKLKSQDNPAEALKHYKEAIEKYEKVLEIQKKTPEENCIKIEKTTKNLTKTKLWRDALQITSSARVGNLCVLKRPKSMRYNWPFKRSRHF